MTNGCPVHTFVWLGHDYLEFLNIFQKTLQNHLHFPRNLHLIIHIKIPLKNCFRKIYILDDL